MTAQPTSPESAKASSAREAMFYDTALRLYVGALALSALEAGLVAARSPGGGASTALTAWLELQPAGFVLTTGLAALLWFARRTLAKGRDAQLLPPAGVPKVRDVVLAAAVLSGPLLGLWQAALLPTFAFRNHELAALLGIALSIALLAVAVLCALWLLSQLMQQRGPRRGRLIRIAACISLLGSVAVIGRAGVIELDPALFAGLAVGGLATWIWRQRSSSAARARKVWLGAGLFAFLGASAAHVAEADALPRIAQQGAWSRYGVAVLRSATDFDRDGYSGWFAGGDCAPFDARVHPGAREIPRDGIDNNCVAGDGGLASAPSAPASEPAPPASVPRPLHFLLITVETLRADHVSFAGSARHDTTPRLKELAKSSTVFTRAYATTPATRLSLAALLSGQQPSSIHWQSQAQFRQMRRLDPSLPWLPTLLQQHGYATYAVHPNFRAFTAVEHAGFDRGFSVYDVSTPVVYVGGTMRGFPSGEQVDRALALLDQRDQRPFFMWLHLLEPHFEYEQSANVPRFGSSEQDRYDAEIAEVDRQIGRLLDGLRSRELSDRTLIAVTGDHGEEFGEHGQRWHNSNLYEPQLRTAALLHVPGLPARRIDAAVSLLDFLPTWLPLLRIQSPAPLSGRNLLAKAAANAPFLVENFRVDDGSNWKLGIVDWPLKLIYTPSTAQMEAYDLQRDPAERRQLEPGTRQLQPLLTTLFQYIENAPGPATEAP